MHITHKRVANLALQNPRKTAEISLKTHKYTPTHDDEKVKPMSEKSFNPFSLALKIFQNLGNTEPRIHPNPREWDAMTFYDHRNNQNT